MMKEAAMPLLTHTQQAEAEDMAGAQICDLTDFLGLTKEEDFRLHPLYEAINYHRTAISHAGMGHWKESQVYSDLARNELEILRMAKDWVFPS